MILNSDAKFKEKLTCSFKHDMRNLINFHPIKSLKISPRRALFVQSIKAWDKKIKRSYLWWHWKVVPNVSENWLVAWKMTRNFVTFHASSWKSENLHLMGSFCQKDIKFYMIKYKRVISHDTGEWCKVWRKTGSWFQKWHD